MPQLEILESLPLRPLAQPEVPVVSVVLPAHNEGDGIRLALETIAGVLRQCNVSFELIVVDDGSRDDTFARVQEAAARHPYVRGLRFSRNFGKEAALLAGLRVARGQAVITMDADLQHPPSAIPELLRCWREGAKVVHAVKRDRSTDSRMQRLRAQLFNGLISRFGRIDLANASDFKLLDRVAVDVLIERLPERGRFYRGLAQWIGFPQANVQFNVAPRVAGAGKWSLLGLVNLAMTAILSFTSAPLRLVTILGFVTLVFAGLVGGEALMSWVQGNAAAGFLTLEFTLLIIGSFVMISLGIVGEYIARIYEELKGRPAYLLEERVGFEDDAGKR